MHGYKAILYDKDKSFKQNLLLIQDRVTAAITFTDLRVELWEKKTSEGKDFGFILAQPKYPKTQWGVWGL